MMDSFYNSNSGFNSSHSSASSNQHPNPNPSSAQSVNNAPVAVPPSMSAGQAAAASGLHGRYSASYNSQAQGNSANSAQYSIAAAAVAAGHSLQTQQRVYGQQQSVPQMQQPLAAQSALPFAPPTGQQVYNPRPAAGGMGSPTAANYGVPNPLGVGGGAPAPPVGGGAPTTAPVAPTGQSKTDLLRSMYQSRHRLQKQQAQAQAQAQAHPGQQVQHQGPQKAQGIQANYHQQQQQQAQAQAQARGMQRPNNAYAGVTGVQNMQQQQAVNYRQQGIAHNAPSSQVQNYQQQRSPQLTALQHAQQQVQHCQQVNQQASQQAYHHQRQQLQQVSQQTYQQQQQQTSTVNVQQYTQQQQVQRQQAMVPSSPNLQSQARQGSSQAQQATHSSSSQHRQQSSHSSSKHRYHLTPAAKNALREAVLSAIRHPNGDVDPGCLQRAMAQGLPKQAILNAAVVARDRDKKNREERRRQHQAQQQGTQSQQLAYHQGMKQTQQQHLSQKQYQSQAVSAPQQQQTQQRQQPQGAVVHHPRQSATSYPPATSAKAQMQKMFPAQPNAASPAQYGPAQQHSQSQQYGQSQKYSQSQQQQMYQQQQQQTEQRSSQLQQQQAQAQARQRQQQLQKQQQYQRQVQQRQLQEEAKRKKLELQYKQEQQRQMLAEQKRRAEEEKKRKEMEDERRRRDAAAKRHAELVARMAPWGRTGFALVVKGRGEGLPSSSQHHETASSTQKAAVTKTILCQSIWGGTQLCKDREPALVAALKQFRGERQNGDEGLPLSVMLNKVNAAADVIRKRLLRHPQPVPKEMMAVEPSFPEESRHKRLAAISAKLLPQVNIDQLKRHKLQPKRESKFLDRHIRRARQVTADSLTKRHKELLKALVNHQSEFYKFHRVKKNEATKLARLIRDQHKKAELAKEKEADAAEKARIAALRANDMAAYTSLLEDTKNDRLKYLLDKTDECMNQISTLLATRVAEEEKDIKMMGGEGRIRATFTEQATGGSYYEAAHVKSEQVRQPSILVGGDLKEYQLSGLQWLVSLYNNRLNGILADEMGLGKTIQTISLIAYLIEVKQNLGPYLVIVPLSTLSNWVNEFAKWLPAATCICYKGTPQQRKHLFRDEVADGHFNVLLTTYEFVIRDKGSLRKLAWQYAIVDEGHRMKNNQSKFAVTLGTHYNTRRRVLLTGTPLQNSLPELWALLNFLLPAIFNSAETFDQWFNKPFASFGKAGASSADNTDDSSNELLSNEERMLIIHRLHELLRPFMLRRVKSEVLDQLPTKVEKVIRCELSSWQKELYKQISHKIAGEAATKNFNRGLNNVVMQLRKVCNHPYLFSQDGYHINEDIIRTSGKVELLDRMLPKLKAAGHRILMFTQMTKMMPILEDYFAYRGFSSLRLDGSTTADEREKRMYMFNAPESPYFIFLLSTRAGGLGLNLATADTVIIFDSDWNPMMDLQAQDRAHRIGQRKDVRVFRIISQTPVEEKILSRATEKLQMNELVVEAGKFDKSGQDIQDTSLERLKMMELLLTDFDQNQSSQGAATSEEDFEKDTDDGEDEDNKDLLNEMISSNDDDYKIYCKIDLERNDSPALYSDINDCPDWILYPNGKPEEGSDAEDNQPELLGKRRAAAGDKVYDDGMTEKQFCRMMDRQAAEEEKGKKKRKKKRSRNAVDPSLIIEDHSGGRKRSKTKHLEIHDAPSRSKVGAFSASSRGSGNEEITAALNDRQISVTRSIIYFKEKGTKRKLSEIFLEKPCPHTYPDYYELIDKPIGINDILRKCRAKLYATVNDFQDDWNTLFKNALTYNGEGSWIVIDAEVLKGEFDRLMDKNALSVRTAASKKPVRIKLSLKKSKNKELQDRDRNENSMLPPAAMKKSTSQSDLNKSASTGDGSDLNTECNSDIVGMDQREASLSKRGKVRSGGSGSRGGVTRLVRRSV